MCLVPRCSNNVVTLAVYWPPIECFQAFLAQETTAAYKGLAQGAEVNVTAALERVQQELLHW